MAAKAAAAADKPPPVDSILLRHLRDSYYLAITVFVYLYAFPLHQAHLGQPSVVDIVGSCEGAKCGWFFGTYFQAGERGVLLDGQWRWMALTVLRNLALCEVIYGGYHRILYEGPGKIGVEKSGAKYNPVWPGAAILAHEKLNNRLGWVQMAVWEIMFVHCWATGRLAYVGSFWGTDAAELQKLGTTQTAVILHSILSVAIIPYWRDWQFYFIHRIMHPLNAKTLLFLPDVGKLLYKHVHSLHHRSYNPGPWSGLAMHPFEHLMYFACVAPQMFLTLHPLHFLFSILHAAIAPLPGHDGLDSLPAEMQTGALAGGGGYAHFLHHAHFDLNYGTVKVPFDLLFGSKVNTWPDDQSGRWKGTAMPLFQIAVPLLLLAGLLVGLGGGHVEVALQPELVHKFFAAAANGTAQEL